MPAYTDYDKRMFDQAEKPGGRASVACLFCPEQINASSTYVENFGKMNWKKSGCQKATCSFWNTSECPEDDPLFDAERCTFWKKN